MFIEQSSVEDSNSDFELLDNDFAKPIQIGTVDWQIHGFCLKNIAGLEQWQIFFH